MISVIIPYWKRKFVFDKVLTQLEMLYSNLEIIVVDDGSGDLKESSRYKLIRLPSKSVAANPCLPINIGVKFATHNIILINNPEVYHKTNVLSDMYAQLKLIGQYGVVSPAVWDVVKETWFVHTTLIGGAQNTGRFHIPKGAPFPFCLMLNRSLYDSVGGYDEAYRRGSGYEDNDFLWRLQRGNAVFNILDHLVVTHEIAPKANWAASGYEINKAVFLSKWNL